MSRWPLLLLLLAGVAAVAQDDARDDDSWDDDSWGDDDWAEETSGWLPLTGFVEAAGGSRCWEGGPTLKIWAKLWAIPRPR